MRPPAGIEGLPGRQAGALATGGLRGRVSAPNLFRQEDAEDLGGIPALGFRGGQHVRGSSAKVGHSHRFQDRGEVLGQRWGAAGSTCRRARSSAGASAGTRVDSRWTRVLTLLVNVSQAASSSANEA